MQFMHTVKGKEQHCMLSKTTKQLKEEYDHMELQSISRAQHINPMSQAEMQYALPKCTVKHE